MLNKELFFKLNQNKNILLKRISNIEKNIDSCKLDYVEKTIRQILKTGSGIYSSKVIEQYFINIATKLKIKNKSDIYIKNTVLMVMSEAYEYGGHTRVVERWVEADKSRKYSLVFTRMNKKNIPDRLIKAIYRSGGKVFYLSGDYKNKAITLSSISSRFEWIILHVHMDDYLPILAYGTTEFRRPIYLYNHADHLFWLGVSIADCVIELRTFGMLLSKNKRGCTSQFKLGIPPDFLMLKKKIKHISKSQNKNKIILSIGSPNKFIPVIGYNFLKMIDSVLSSTDGVIFIGIGVNKEDFRCSVNSSKMFFYERVSYGELYSYILNADLVVDSFPLAGATTITDVVLCDIPVLSLSNPGGLLDWLIDSPAYCSTVNQLIDKAKKILASKEYAKTHAERTKNYLLNEINLDLFQSKLDYIFSNLRKSHEINNFSSRFDGYSELDAYLLESNKKIKILLDFCKIKIIKEKTIIYKQFFIKFNRFMIKLFKINNY